LLGHNGSIFYLAFSDDGKLLASWSTDGTIRLWNVQTQQWIGAKLRAGDNPMRICFSRDGKRLLSLSHEGHLLAWNLEPPTWAALARNIMNRNLTEKEWDLYVGTGEIYSRTFPSLPTPK
jgi:WD40 repeat protein